MTYEFECIDGHTCGNPVRVVKTGGPELIGESMIEKRQYFLDHFDWVRTGLMFEPRGHDMMSGAILYPPTRADCDIAILFIETSGCLPMCGHGTIGTVTIALECELVSPQKPGILRLDTPAGVVVAEYSQTSKGKVEWVKLTNIPSFLYASNLEIESEHLGQLTVDVAYGGNFYAIIEAQENYQDMSDYSAGELIAMSKQIRTSLNEKYTFIHPENPAIHGLSHIEWTGKAQDRNAHARNAVYYGDKAIDRSPCGTGTSARMAQLHAKGLLKVGSEFVHESIIGSLFKGGIVSETRVGERKAIIPSIQGWAKIHGYNTILIDKEDDPYAYGFQVI